MSRSKHIYPMKSFLNAPSFLSLVVDSVKAKNLRIPVVAAPRPSAAALATISSFNGMIPGVIVLAITGAATMVLGADGMTVFKDA